MTECINSAKNITTEPQCQFFVVRKKRLCRMTVRPGRQYCGEHEPQPQTDDGVSDTRIPCPNDPKHTCYASKLEKHLSICNARQVASPEYIVHNINIPTITDESPRRLLSEVPKDVLMEVIDKVNVIYDKYLKDKIEAVPEQAIHHSVLSEFNDASRTESSRRHLRQASSLLRLVEREGLVRDHTTYAELGAGKGQLSYYAWSAWCSPQSGRAGSGVLLVDRASLRHKRDNKIRPAGVAATDADAGGGVVRLRADLAHLALARVPVVHRAHRLVSLAKHLCGVATDYALRCVCSAECARVPRGVVLATCCHHRCLPHLYVGRDQLQELGITNEDLNVMLGVVSWATCGDGRSRRRRGEGETHGDEDSPCGRTDQETPEEDDCKDHQEHKLSQARRAEAGRRAKAVLDWGRALFLRGHGFDARLCHYVPAAVSPENICIVATANT